jgi:sec-independent protein translocase protein TatA
MPIPTFGPTELIIILILVLILFGAGRLADVGAALGKSVRGFRQGAKEAEEPPDASKRS